MTVNLKPDPLVLKCSPKKEVFCNKLTQSYTTQYPDLFIAYKEGFNMHTAKRNLLQLPEDEQYTKLSYQLISDKLMHTQNKSPFPAPNSSNYFATIDYEAQTNTKIEYFIKPLKLKEPNF